MSQENVEIVRAVYEAVARGDTDSPFQCPDIEWRLAGSGHPLGIDRVYHGHRGVALMKWWFAAAVDLIVKSSPVGRGRRRSPWRTAGADRTVQERR